MDLAPFGGINPCGFKRLAVTQLADHVASVDQGAVARRLTSILIGQLGYE